MVVSDHIRIQNARQLTLEILDDLFTGSGTELVSVRLWDGTLWPDQQARPVTLVLQHPGALRAMFLPGTELGLAEAYLYNDFDIEGDIETVFWLAENFEQKSLGWQKKLVTLRKLRKLPEERISRDGRRGPAEMSGRQHTVDRDQQAIRYHYDVSNDFFRLWLDRRLIYSCAYFRSPQDSLDQAQEQKLELICRKLRLKPGQRLLDIGCGWGGLSVYAAQHYGVSVTGITLSLAQAELATERVKEAGLEERVRIEIRDYREIEEQEPYDALVSVGMFEHVGARMLVLYFQQAWRLLRRGGVFLNHGIAINARVKLPRGPNFSDTYVFPDGELVPINVTLDAAEDSGFEVRDVESLREHYAMTLRHWVQNLERNHSQALQVVDEPTYRVWRLFMSGSAQGFTSGRLNIYQSLLVKPAIQGDSGLPLTREDWYSPPLS